MLVARSLLIASAGTLSARAYGLVANILVVDDEPNVRSVVGEVLRDEGYGVATAANGIEALKRMHECTPDGIILDLNMPGMNGKAFLSACRSDPAYASVPVALFTTAQDADAIAEDMGVQLRIAKPFDVDALAVAVRRLLRRNPSLSTEPEAPSPATTRLEVHADRYASVIEAMRCELAALRRQIRTARCRLESRPARVAASNACLDRAHERIQRSRQYCRRPTAGSRAGERGGRR